MKRREDLALKSSQDLFDTIINVSLVIGIEVGPEKLYHISFYSHKFSQIYLLALPPLIKEEREVREDKREQHPKPAISPDAII